MSKIVIKKNRKRERLEHSYWVNGIFLGVAGGIIGGFIVTSIFRIIDNFTIDNLLNGDGLVLSFCFIFFYMIFLAGEVSIIKYDDINQAYSDYLRETKDLVFKDLDNRVAAALFIFAPGVLISISLFSNMLSLF